MDYFYVHHPHGISHNTSTFAVAFCDIELVNCVQQLLFSPIKASCFFLYHVKHFCLSQILTFSIYDVKLDSTETLAGFVCVCLGLFWGFIFFVLFFSFWPQ